MRFFGVLLLFLALPCAFAAENARVPGLKLRNTVAQAYDAVYAGQTDRKFELTDLQEYELLDREVREIDEPQFDFVMIHSVQRLRNLAFEASEIIVERESPFGIGESTDSNRPPSKNRPISEIRKDARQLLRFILVQSLRTNTPATLRAKKRVMTYRYAAGIASLASMAALVLKRSVAGPVADTFLAVGTSVATASLGTLIGVTKSNATELLESERLFRNFAGQMRTQGVEWEDFGVNMREELKILAALPIQIKNGPQLCKELLGDAELLDPVPRTRREDNYWPRLVSRIATEPVSETALNAAPAGPIDEERIPDTLPSQRIPR